MDGKKTLFEIVIDVLSQYQDANILSAEAKHRIADDICNSYYDNIDPEIFDEEDLDLGNIK